MKFTSLKDFRAYLESKIVGHLYVEPSVYGSIKDHINSQMFKDPLYKSIVEQFEAANTLFLSGSSPDMYPSVDDILLLITDPRRAKDLTQHLAQPYQILSGCMFFIELNVRETCISWLNKIRISGLPLTQQISQMESWDNDTFSTVQDVKRQLILAGEQKTAALFQQVEDRVQAKVTQLKTRKSVIDAVRTINTMAAVNPLDLAAYRDQLAAIIDTLDEWIEKDPTIVQKPSLDIVMA
jgi:hypothetical protein